MKSLILSIAILLAGFTLIKASTVYQINTISGLYAGLYQQETTVQDACNKKVNFGVGAGVGLNEVVVLNGKYYIFDGYGNGREMKDNEGLCFLTGVNFSPSFGNTITLNIKNVASLNELQQLIEGVLKIDQPENVKKYYAIKVSGTYTNVPLRSEDRVPDTDLKNVENLQPLTEWMSPGAGHQHFFCRHGIKGTLVGFFTPGLNGQEISNAKGAYFHFHFLADNIFGNSYWGGHVIERANTGKLKIDNAEVTIIPYNEITTSL